MILTFARTKYVIVENEPNFSRKGEGAGMKIGGEYMHICTMVVFEPLVKFIPVTKLNSAPTQNLGIQPYSGLHESSHSTLA